MEYKGFTYTPTPKTAWDNLSMLEKSEMMKVAVRNGITDLNDIREKYNEFAEGGDTNEERPTIVPFRQKTEVIITPDSEYNQYLNTLPDNQRFTPNDEYDSYLYWKLHGKPRNFEEAYNSDMFHYDHSDNAYHANSIAWGDDGIGYFMKPKTHDTVGYELDWFNKGLVTEEGGHQRPETPEEKLEADEFRKNYILIDDPVRTNFYRYQPVERAEGGKIYIKPENRGKFTAMKERTGHSATWFKEHGTPAQKKMATFALNARHWKHGLGGNLFAPGGDTKASDYRYVLDDDGEWNRVANDEMGRVFQGLTVTPRKTKQKFVPERIDNSLEAAKARDKFFQYRDEEGHIKGEPGLEIVSPEFEILMGARMAMPTYSQEATRNYKIAKSFKADTKRMPSVNSAFRNEEWSNFLSTRNGDNYYRLVDKSKEAYSPKEKYFISHTTPWEEFSGLGTRETIGTDKLYEFPTEVFGKLRSSTSRGLPTEFDVTEMGRKHLLYGNTSSGMRGPVRVLSDKNAAAIGESPFKIGVIERPTLENGFYDSSPVYEELGMGNQTVLKGSTLERNINDSTYNIFERTPFGILKTLHIGK